MSASQPLADIVLTYTENARSQAKSGAAVSAFAQWQQTATTSLSASEARLLFAGESAFAAAARTILEDEIYLGDHHFQKLFPHLYSSPLFTWYQPPARLRRRLHQSLKNRSEQPETMLTLLYEQSIPTSVRKHFSQFYTPASLVEFMLDEVGFKGAKILEAKLIDPAAGAGAFVVAATRRVLKAAQVAKLSPLATCEAVQRVIHGLDVNALGILLTEAALAFELAPYLVHAGASAQLQPLHLYVTDTLQSNAADSAYDLKNRVREYEHGFTHVVANPPYGKYPSRLLDSEQKQRFAASVYGHPNLYGLFLQVGTELLGERGRLAYITPRSFVSGLYFRRLRHFLTHNLNLKAFTTFDKRTGMFENVLQEVVVVSAARSRQQQRIRLREYEGADTRKPAKEITVEATSVILDEAFDYAFFVSADDLAHRVLAKMRVHSQPLSALGFEVVTGTVVWNRLRDHIQNEVAENTLPLIWSNGVRAFSFTGLGNRNGEYTHCALTEKTKSITCEGEAVLVKRMTSREEKRRVVACRLPPEFVGAHKSYFVENHVNIVRARENSEISLDAVLGLLNSHLFDYLFRALNGNTNVSATEIALLPVRLDRQRLEKIAEISRTLSATGGDDSSLLAVLDASVYKLYRLSEAEIGELEALKA